MFNQHPITAYIPQREPFIMVDLVTLCENDHFQTNFLVTKDNLFIKNDLLSESAVLENIAQTCAAGMGCYAIHFGSGEQSTGFIGSINKVKVLANAKVNDVITTDVKVLHQLDNIYLIEGIAKVNDTILVTCQMKIVA